MKGCSVRQGLYLRHYSLEASMNASSNCGCWQRRENKAPSVRWELVMAAVEGKVESYRPVSDWLSMENVSAYMQHAF